MPILLHSQSLTPYHRLNTLIENRSIVELPYFQLNTFETYQTSEQVSLCFDSLTVTAMLRGKKRMHLFESVSFDYLPGETVIVPANEEMRIDFPEANIENPTQCLALAIDNDKIKRTIDLLNEKYPKIDSANQWHINKTNYHLLNTPCLKNTLDRLVQITLQETNCQEILAETTLQELLIRLMQTQARYTIFEQYEKYTTQNRFAFIIGYIEENLDRNITVQELSEKACMSESHFYKQFKREFGISPIEYLIQKRISYAKKLLLDFNLSISDVCYRLGFSSLSYFSTLFKKYENISPTAFRKKWFK